MTFPSFTRRLDMHFGRNIKDHLLVPSQFTEKEASPQRINYLGLV